MTTSLLVRRSVTIVGVALAIIVGFGTIRVAAAWTAASAPLVVAPTTAATLQGRLADEQTRSAALTDQLTALAVQAGTWRRPSNRHRPGSRRTRDTRRPWPRS